MWAVLKGCRHGAATLSSIERPRAVLAYRKATCIVSFDWVLLFLFLKIRCFPYWFLISTMFIATFGLFESGRRLRSQAI